MQIFFHRYVSAAPEGLDSTKVRGSNWNDAHVFSGGNKGSIALRDTDDATYGSNWLQSVAVGQVLASQGVGSLPAYTAVPLVNGVRFPATQVNDADPNTLDDYEEGTFTPTIGGATSESGQAYATQLGHYVKIGRFVKVHLVITLSTLGTITGNVRVKNLPFSVDGSIDFQQAPILWDTTNTAYVYMVAFFVSGTTHAELRAITAASTGLGTVAQANLANNTTIILSGSYRVA